VGIGDSSWRQIVPCATEKAFKDFCFAVDPIYADDDSLSISGSSFLPVVAAVPEIIDYPSTRHQNAGGFGFCDGHSEMHRWQSNVMVMPSDTDPGGITVRTGAEMQDWSWFAWHATRSFITGTVP
jgi:prepilin-type processing-associated H-X9-DG protein